ncbi:MAG: hypothetical protein NZL92_08715 [Gloeomargarita sp. SKYG116]|nr:hypothetical protein [Gloeomargarita sp. SKYG116]MCS7226206.1 hypothetical protein [Gloeomargarita sp. SKYB31]MDW8401764.1 hypothetical protein [Gloeomargarita sp. SKYGB_i_bin116]
MEVDVTTYTGVNDYAPDRVPKVWLWRNSHLQMYALAGENCT